jgi:nitroreductase
MDIHKLTAKTRTFRRFNERLPIATTDLHELVELARLAGSARNCQPWQYMIVNDTEVCGKIFPYIGWAGYLTDWKGPIAGERPTAYILCLLNHDWLKGSEKEAHFDLGIASQNILLGATTKKLGGCRIGSFSPKVKNLFAIPDHLSLELIIALGSPVEQVQIEDAVVKDDIKYWRDAQQLHHVPKRKLQDVLIQFDCVFPETE